MTKKDLFKNIIEQNSPDKNDILANVLTNRVGRDALGTPPKINFKRIIKYTLPALMVLTILFVQIFATPIITNQQQIPENAEDNAIVQTQKSRNWFGIVAYAADVDEKGEPIINDIDTGVELKKDVKIDLISEFILNISWTDKSGLKESRELYLTKLKLLSLKIDGENIKSINIKCETGMIYLGKKRNDAKSYSVINGRNFTCKKEDFIQWEPTSKTITDDTITITVTFDDGEEITQIIEVTFDEKGDIYAELKDK